MASIIILNLVVYTDAADETPRTVHLLSFDVNRLSAPWQGTSRVPEIS